MLRTLLITVAVFSLGGCATWAQPVAATGQCRVEGPRLWVSGPTDQRMLDCLRSAADISTVEMTSEGGSVRSAIEIGRHLKAMGAELVIADYCESSCANYLVPAARSLRVRPDARLVLHGSVDGWAVDRGASTDLFNLQRSYAEEVGITPGWFLMRSAADGSANQYGPFLMVDGGPSPPTNTRYIIVEPALLLSCLPALDVVWEEPSYARRTEASGSRKRRLERTGFAFSGGLRCAPDQTYPLLDGSRATD